MKRTAMLLGLALIVILIAACSEPIDFVDEVATEVKVTNDLFLVVNTVTPANNRTNIDPGKRLVIEFDRAVNPATISSSSIVISDGSTEAVWSYEYNSANNSLYIYPEPYLDSYKSYSVTLGSGLRGTDGSSLKEQYVWSFETGLYPAGSVVINNDSNPETDDSWTDSRNVALEITTNSKVLGYRYVDYAADAPAPAVDLDIGSTSDWQSVTPNMLASTVTTANIALSGSSDGDRVVYVQFNDGYSVTEWESDSIEVDENPPLVSGFTLNSGAAYTPSLRPKLGFTVEETYPLQWRQSIDDSNWSTWQNLSPGTYSGLTAARYFSSAEGDKTYYLQFRDSHYTTVVAAQAGIKLAVPELLYADKGFSKEGKIHVVLDTANIPAGTTYNLYTSSSPDTDPEVVLKYGFVTKTTESEAVFSIKPGEPTFIWVQAYNSDTGGSGPLNSDPELSYYSDITVVFNGADEKDAALAKLIREILYTDIPAKYEEVKGDMPKFSVTLLPQEYIAPGFDTKQYKDILGNTVYADVIYGRPIIVTPGYKPDSAGQMQNIAQGDSVRKSNRLFMMGNGGELLKAIIDNFSGWNLTDIQPAALYGATTAEKTLYITTWNSTSGVWSKPLVSAWFKWDAPQDDMNVQIAKTYLYDYALTFDYKNLPAGVELFGKRYKSSDLYNVVRQGNYLLYGFVPIMPDIPQSGWVHFINLVWLMSQ